MIRSPRVRQPLAALSLGLTVGGCTSWRVEPGNRSQAIAQSARHAIRVQMRDGEVLVIDDPKVVGDSIRGAMRYAPGNPASLWLFQTCNASRQPSSTPARHFSCSELFYR